MFRAWSFWLLVLTAGAADECGEPNAFALTSTAERSMWSFLAKVDFSSMDFQMTEGYCRNGDTWAHDPRVHTNMGAVRGASNNQFGDNLWFCFAEPRNQIECLAECAARWACAAADRPPGFEKQECCLFNKGNTGDSAANRECWVRKELPLEELPANAMVDTSVTVMPIPFVSYLRLTSGSAGLTASATRSFCPTWTWCSFKIKDCFGNLLYDVRSMKQADMDREGNTLLGTSVNIYEIYNAAGEYLGRTSALTEGGEPVRFFNTNNQEVALTVSPQLGFLQFLYDYAWYVGVRNPNIPVVQEPMQDPRLLTFIVVFQFRSLGYVGGALSILFWSLVFLLILYLAWIAFKVHNGEWLGFGECLNWTRNLISDFCPWCTWCAGCFSCCLPKRSRIQFNDGGYACCGGRGKGPWTTKLDTLTPIE